MSTILIIDDDETSRHYLNIVLWPICHKVTTSDYLSAQTLINNDNYSLIIISVKSALDSSDLSDLLAYDVVTRKQSSFIVYAPSLDGDQENQLKGIAANIHFLPRPSKPEVILFKIYETLKYRQKIVTHHSNIYAYEEEAPQKNSKLVVRISELETAIDNLLSKGTSKKSNIDELKLSALAELSVELSCDHSSISFFKLLSRTAKALLTAKHMAIGIYLRGENKLVHLFADGMSSQAKASLLQIDPSTGIFQEISQTGTPYRANDLNKKVSISGLPESHSTFNSFMIIPIKFDSPIEGWLYVGDKLIDNYFTDDDERLAISIITQIISARKNTILFHELSHRSKTLEEEVNERKRINAELEKSKARLNGIIESATDAIITIDEDENIVLCNHAAANLFKMEITALMGSSLSNLLPARYGQSHHKEIKRFGSTGITARSMAGHLSVTALKSDGTEFPIQASISQLLENEKKFYTVILRDITEQQRAQQELKKSHDQLSELSSALQSIREEERKYFARELHDDLGQLLSALKMDLVILRSNFAKEQSSLISKADSMERIIDQAVVSMRRMATALRPKVLDELGLLPALHGLVKDFSDNSGVDCQLIADELIDINDPLATAFFRVTQEALTNVSRHAKATKATVSLQFTPRGYELRISDNGQGMAESDRYKPKHYGLLGIGERTKMLGGEIHIDSKKDMGTTLMIVIPQNYRAP